MFDSDDDHEAFLRRKHIKPEPELGPVDWAALGIAHPDPDRYESAVQTVDLLDPFASLIAAEIAEIGTIQAYMNRLRRRPPGGSENRP